MTDRGTLAPTEHNPAADLESIVEQRLNEEREAILAEIERRLKQRHVSGLERIVLDSLAAWVAWRVTTTVDS